MTATLRIRNITKVTNQRRVRGELSVFDTAHDEIWIGWDARDGSKAHDFTIVLNAVQARDLSDYLTGVLPTPTQEATP
jgi:hypothetical protein